MEDNWGVAFHVSSYRGEYFNICVSKKRGYTVLALSAFPSVLLSVTISPTTMHHSHFKLSMVLWLGVLHFAYRIQVCQLSTSCFTTYFIFRHSVPTQNVSATLFSATMHHSLFKLGMVRWLGVLHVAYRIQVCQLSTSCFTTWFIFLVTWQIVVTPWGGILSVELLTDFLFSYIINPFPHNDTFWLPWETSLLKTLWEKEKLLVTSNFSFSHSVF